MPACNSEREQKIVARARRQLAVYEDLAELIRLGAYKTGTNAEVDEAAKIYPQLEAFLAQRKDEHSTLEDAYQALDAIVGAGKDEAS